MQVAEGFEFHIATNSKIHAVLTLDRSHVGVAALVADFSVEVAGAPVESYLVFCHMGCVYRPLGGTAISYDKRVPRARCSGWETHRLG